MSYAFESAALDAELLDRIGRWHRNGHEMSEADFDDLALRLLSYQLDYDRPYARYCGSLGVTRSSLPDTWRRIPAVPSEAFKDATLVTFDPSRAALAFQTSGTSGGAGGRHYMETRELYDAALTAAFDRFVLSDRARLRYLNAVPNPAERPQSSLGYMMAVVAGARGDGQTGWYVRGEALLFEAFVADARAAAQECRAVCLTATTFALANLLDELERRRITIAFAPGSRIVETGGFKGRARIVTRSDLYERACAAFGITPADVISEYGMTELSSQYYDAPSSRGEPETRRKVSPSWLRSRVVGPNGEDVPKGTVGALVHVDLANRSSCIAIATADLGVAFDDGLVLLGRDSGASLRGCSLDAETLRPR